MKEQLDHDAFFAALNAHRLSKGMNWKEVADVIGMSASTLTRMGQGKRPDLDGFAALLKWSGLSADDFIPSPQRNRPETIAQITALLRADSKLDAKAKKTLESVLIATYESLKK